MAIAGIRHRTRVGRPVLYRPTDAQASAGGGSAGDAWAATISNVNVTGTVNLLVAEADGGILSVTAISRGQRKGTYDTAAGSAAV